MSFFYYRQGTKLVTKTDHRSSVKTELVYGVPLTPGKSNGPASLLVGPFPFSSRPDAAWPNAIDPSFP
jgi:hypothetical protein